MHDCEMFPSFPHDAKSAGIYQGDCKENHLAAFSFGTTRNADINRPIVLEPRRSLWKLSGATFSAKQSSVAMIQDGSREGRRKTDWPSTTINQSEEETASDREHAYRHGGCTRDTIKLVACATFRMNGRVYIHTAETVGRERHVAKTVLS